MRSSLPLALTTFLATLSPFALQADSLTVEGDLNVTATESANGDLTVDNELTVNEDTTVTSGVKAAFKVEPNGVIWAGQAASYNETYMTPEGDGKRIMWIPQKGALRVGGAYHELWRGSVYENVGEGSVAFGYYTISSGEGSMAWGEANAYGACSTAWGRSISSGTYTTSWGESYAYGYNTTAWGDASVANKANDTSWGYYTFAGGGNSTAWGANTTASGWASTAMGTSTIAEASFVTVMGAYNVESGYTIDGNEYDWDDGWYHWFDLDLLVAVGNGTSDSNRANALTIIKNGQTTLENKYWDDTDPTAIPADPDTELDGDQSSAGEALVVNGHARFEGRVSINYIEPQGDISMGAFTAQTPN